MTISDVIEIAGIARNIRARSVVVRARGACYARRFTRRILVRARRTYRARARTGRRTIGLHVQDGARRAHVIATALAAGPLILRRSAVRAVV